MKYALYVIAALSCINPLAAIYMIGKPRKPITAGQAVGYVVNGAVCVTILVLAARQVHG